MGPQPGQRRDIPAAAKSAVLARDGWVCGICGVSVAENRTTPHPLSLTYDHIVEVRGGGDESPSNLRVAHSRCNIVRSNPDAPRIDLDLEALVRERDRAEAAGDVFSRALHGPSLPYPPPAVSPAEIGPLYDRVMANTARHIDQKVRASKARLIEAGRKGEDSLSEAIEDVREDIAVSYREVFGNMLPDILALAPFYEATPAPRGLVASVGFGESHPALYAVDFTEELLVDAGIDAALDAAEYRTMLAPETGRTWEKLFRDYEETLPRLKRQKDLRPALTLALSLVDDAERLSATDNPPGPPPPAYTEQAAIVYRKMKDYRGEVAVLERYEKTCRSRGGFAPGKRPAALMARLEKARALRDKNRSAAP